MEQVNSATTTASAPTVPVNTVWRTLKNYVLWSYERGTIHYDVMVTLILLFVFFSPRLINFNDKPVEHSPHRTEVVVTSDGHGGLIYRIEGSAVASGTANEQREQMLRIIEPISGEVAIDRVEPTRDHSGRVLTYNVYVSRQ